MDSTSITSRKKICILLWRRQHARRRGQPPAASGATHATARGSGARPRSGGARHDDAGGQRQPQGGGAFGPWWRNTHACAAPRRAADSVCGCSGGARGDGSGARGNGWPSGRRCLHLLRVPRVPAPLQPPDRPTASGRSGSAPTRAVYRARLDVLAAPTPLHPPDRAPAAGRSGSAPTRALFRGRLDVLAAPMPLRPPDRAPAAGRTTAPTPARVHATASARVHLRVRGLPSEASPSTPRRRRRRSPTAPRPKSIEAKAEEWSKEKAASGVPQEECVLPFLQKGAPRKVRTWLNGSLCF
uniref:Uncharacterized protein n=1 Tax=Setaria italica TaxID=4555 RepID=K3YL04_SETIT